MSKKNKLKDAWGNSVTSTPTDVVINGKLHRWIFENNNWVIKVIDEPKPRRLPQGAGQSEIWREDGKCGICGREKFFKDLYLVCPEHGIAEGV